jgi:hypothetical protein
MAKTTKKLPEGLPFNITSSRAIPRDQALLISGPLRIRALPGLAEYFAGLGEKGVELVDNNSTIEFASFEHAAAGLCMAEVCQVITHDQAKDLIREAAEELGKSERAVLIKNIGKIKRGEDHEG